MIEGGACFEKGRTMRLQKYIAAAGVCSRREAEEYIRAGKVTVNGTVASIGDGAEAGDTVCLNGKRLTLPEEHTYIVLHKPRGYVTTMHDTHDRPTVAELVQDAGVRLFPVGRLDCMSEGLLLFTDDGETANRMAHPSHGVSKTYRVWVAGPEAAKAAAMLRTSITYNGVRYRPAEVRVLRSTEDTALIDVTIREGKNREVRNMCAAAGLKVQRLMRIRQGEISLGDLPAGQWRYLTEKETEYLHTLR